MAVFDVHAGALIKEIASDLKNQGIKQPEWALFAKTGAHKERAPDSRDWFYDRMASVLYRIYKQGPLGTEALRNYYGGKKRRGVKRPHFRKAGGKIIRLCLQELEKQGLVKKGKKGRIITGKGQGYLNAKAKATAAAAEQMRGKPVEKEKPAVEEKTEEERRVEEELKRQEAAEKHKEKEKEEARKREKKKEEKKPAEKEEA